LYQRVRFFAFALFGRFEVAESKVANCSDRSRAVSPSGDTLILERTLSERIRVIDVFRDSPTDRANRLPMPFGARERS